MKYTKDLAEALSRELPEKSELLRISWENPDCVQVDLRFAFTEEQFDKIKQTVIREL